MVNGLIGFRQIVRCRSAQPKRTCGLLANTQNLNLNKRSALRI